MNIAVCIKQVPGGAGVQLDPVSRQLIRDSVPAVINPFDYHALEAAILLKEEFGGRVVALSMGPPKAEAALREALAFGADEAVLLSDRRFAGSDTWATSYVLSRAVRKLGGIDLVLCGRQAIDGDTAQIGPELAAQLGWPQALNAAELRFEGDSLLVKRLLDDGYDRCRVRLPAVVSVVRELNTPRVPTLKGYLRAVMAEVTARDASALECDDARLGLKGSPTRVVSTAPPPPRSGIRKHLNPDQLNELLKELEHAPNS